MAEAYRLSDNSTGLRAAPARETGRCPLVLLHGVGMSSRFWEPQLIRFGGERVCIALDMLGHGNSPLPPENASLDDYAAQLTRAMVAFGIRRAVLVGHSMGALVAIHHALSEPERVATLVPMNAVFRRDPEQKAAVLARLSDLREGRAGLDRTATLRRWFGGDPAPAQRESWNALDQALGEIDPIGYARSYGLFATSDEAHADAIATLVPPACFLTGALDPNSTPAMSHAMAALAPHGRAVVLPGERHMMSFISPDSTNLVLDEILQNEDRRLLQEASATELA